MQKVLRMQFSYRTTTAMIDDWSCALLCTSRTSNCFGSKRINYTNYFNSASVWSEGKNPLTNGNLWGLHSSTIFHPIVFYGRYCCKGYSAHFSISCRNIWVSVGEGARNRVWNFRSHFSPLRSRIFSHSKSLSITLPTEYTLWRRFERKAVPPQSLKMSHGRRTYDSLGGLIIAICGAMVRLGPSETVTAEISNFSPI